MDFDTDKGVRYAHRDGPFYGTVTVPRPPSDGNGRSPVPAPRLTALEVRILAEVASGASNKEIGERLGYSVYYVKDVVAGARRRLGARDRAHAAARAVALGVIEDEGDGCFTPVRLRRSPPTDR